MKKQLKNLVVIALTILSLNLVGCSSESKEVAPEDNKTPSQNTAVTDYERYLADRYNTYFNNEEILTQYGTYNIYADNFAYPGTYDEFIVGYNDFYANEKANLEAFKKDIESNYKAGDPDVDKLHTEVITSVDKSISTLDEYGATFAEKTKDFGTYTQDEVVKGLRDIGKAPYEARMEFNKIVEDAKARMGID